ncbi:hypothetical protein [Streptomyces chromofuscus]|uniref:Uncharacterized protein n=1 Tax=Streptomyces chromofuscus TaxID=42881 RepID=A0A7M2T4C0_STRCW|nr:hypothetical protein [Streptomyces chromofuscus]QOV43510.1 hypothetical protein IPT68_27875 [Streptomyces chromofuscus]GGT10105.1 hypothetical protein GCM10010254_33350 [Streptomyces chromofuscus]
MAVSAGAPSVGDRGGLEEGEVAADDAGKDGEQDQERDEVQYRNSGVPLEEYELTRGDHRRQKQSEEISEWDRRQTEEDDAKCRADPERAERRRQAFKNVAKLMQSFKKADHEIMRWRVRLYCGHIIETQAHYTYTDPLSAGSYGRRCSECGEDRQTIVAFEPIGLRGEPPEPTEPKRSSPPKKPTRADLERRVKTLEKENERLRAKLSG